MPSEQNKTKRISEIYAIFEAVKQMRENLSFAEISNREQIASLVRLDKLRRDDTITEDQYLEQSSMMKKAREKYAAAASEKEIGKGLEFQEDSLVKLLRITSDNTVPTGDREELVAIVQDRDTIIDLDSIHEVLTGGLTPDEKNEIETITANIDKNEPITELARNFKEAAKLIRAAIDHLQDAIDALKDFLVKFSDVASEDQKNKEEEKKKEEVDLAEKESAPEEPEINDNPIEEYDEKHKKRERDMDEIPDEALDAFEEKYKKEENGKNETKAPLSTLYTDDDDEEFDVEDEDETTERAMEDNLVESLEDETAAMSALFSADGPKIEKEKPEEQEGESLNQGNPPKQ